MNDDSFGSHVKDVYAHFGLAHYLAQVLEHGIVNAFVYLELIPSSLKSNEVKSRAEWTANFDEFMDRKFEATLGRLIRGLREHATITEELERTLSAALLRRNWLAHGYFRDRASSFLTTEGCDAMILELQESQKLFEDADQMLEAATKPNRLKYGFTDDLLAAAEAEYLDDHKSEVRPTPNDA